MLSHKHEVPLRERKTSTGSTTEILVQVASGKTYLSDPSKTVNRPAQKGNVCWYYALSYIRDRHGKKFHHANRHAEKVISAYRKKITDSEKSAALIKNLLVQLPFGLEESEIKLGQLDSILAEKTALPVHEAHNSNNTIDRYYLASPQDLENRENLNLFLKLQAIILRLFMAKDVASKNKLLAEIHTLILPNNTSSAIVNINVEDKIPYHAFMAIVGNISQTMQSRSDNNEVASIQSKLAILGLALLETQAKLVEKKYIGLTLSQVIEYHKMADIAIAAFELLDKFDIRIELSFIKKLLHHKLKDKTNFDEIADLIYDGISKKQFEIPSTVEITQANFDIIKIFSSILQIIAYQYSIELYGLHNANWSPPKGFNALMECLQDSGAIVMQGNNIGLPFYQGAPHTLTEDQKPVKIGSRSIQFWQKNQFTPSDDQCAHAIIVIGAEELKDTNGKVTAQHVFFLDPNDVSSPNEERKVYSMDYSDFASRLITVQGLSFADRTNEMTSEDVFAIRR